MVGCHTSSGTFKLNHWVEMQHIPAKNAIKTLEYVAQSRFCEFNQTACLNIVDYSYISDFVSQLFHNPSAHKFQKTPSCEWCSQRDSRAGEVNAVTLLWAHGCLCILSALEICWVRLCAYLSLHSDLCVFVCVCYWICFSIFGKDSLLAVRTG